MRHTRVGRWLALTGVLALALVLAATSGPVRVGAAATPVPGQTTTLLPDGRWLILGGESARGPSATALIQEPHTTAVTPVPALAQPRSGHTATVLPDGSVLILGGLTSGGQLGEAVLFQPETLAATPLPQIGLTPRAGHTATLLTDGRVFVAGGVSAQGAPLATAELWTSQSGLVETIPSPVDASRRGATATLQFDGRVALSGGVDARGLPAARDTVFDPNANGFVSSPAAASLSGQPQVAASEPAAGASDVPVDGRLVLRLATPLRVDPATEHTITLAGPQGPEAARVVFAEDGRLVFVTPTAPLTPGTRYTLTVNGAEDHTGLLVPFTAIDFTTAPLAAPPTSSAVEAGRAPHHDHQAHGGDADEHSHLPKVRPQLGGRVELDDTTWRGERDADGKPRSRWQNLPPLRARPGVTALAGQVLRLNGEPLAQVTLKIGGAETRTDHTGRFLLPGVPAGRQGLLIDGSTANTRGRTYGSFFPGVDIAAGTTTVLPWTVWMPLIDMAHAVPLPVPTAGPMVVTSPRIPGLEVHIPGNVILQTSEGPLTVVALTRLSVEQPPFPVPDGATFLWTPQTHGALVVRPDGTPSPVGVRFILPNVDGFPAGRRVGLQGYSVTKGWYVYGHGTVSADGKQIVPDPGVQFQRVTCIFLATTPTWEARIPGGETLGDPVDVGTGLFTMEKTDLVLPDVIPIVLQRQHRPGDSSVSLFGKGQADLYAMTLTADHPTYSVVTVVLGDGARIRFDVTTNPTGALDTRIWEHTATPTAWQKAKVIYQGTATDRWLVTRKDGTQYEFSGHGGSYLLAIRDPRGNQLTIERVYTPPGPGDWGKFSRWPLRIISPNGRIVEFTTNTATVGEERITQATDLTTGRTVSYSYDGSKRLTSVTDAGSGVTEYTYDGTSQRIATIKDPRNIVWLTNTYDANGRVTVQTFADSTTWQFAYTLDGSGKVTQTDATDPRGNVRRLTFNTAGRVLTSTRAYGTGIAQTTTYTRDATTHLPTRITDALGRHTDFTYDTKGNTLTVTRLAGTGNAVTTTYTYTSAFNQVATITDPLSHTTTFGYDGAGNLISVTNALSQATTFTYDARGKVLTATDPLSQTSTYAYLQGDLYAVTTPLGRTTTRFTDAAGRVAGVTDPLGRSTRYTWNNLNQLTKITDPLGGETQFSYDGNGNLLSLTDARSNATTYTYSNMDRIATRTDPLTHAEGFSYDNNGNLTSHTDRKSQVTGRTYDALDRLTQVTFQGGATIDYTWDAGNRVTQFVDSVNGTITRTYDTLDRLTQEVTPNGTINYTYDAADRRASMTVLGQTAITYTHDNTDRLTQIAQGSTTVSFGYDAAGRRTSLTSPNGVVTEYSYDAASRLIGQTFKNGANTLGTLTYGYDSNGSRVTTAGTWARTGLPSTIASATYNAANQQTAFAGSTQTFDLNGNLISDGTTTYTWDARNQLVSLSGGSTASFAYDALGRRWSKTINSTQTRFHYDGLTPAQELDGSGIVAATLLTGAGIDEYLARTDGGGTRSLLTDLLGSMVVELDDSVTTQAEYTSEPFGKTVLSGASANAFRYTGREDDGTGLYYYRARYYHPSLQRFISQDPIGFLGGDVNVYSYGRQNPISFVDPLGLDVRVAYYPTLATHVGIGVNDNPTVGFYPTNAVYGALSILGLNVPGAIRRDDGTPAKVITIKTTPEQDRIIQEAINARIANPGSYNLYGRNCTFFVTDVLRAASVPVSPTWLPENLVKKAPTHLETPSR